MANKGQNAIKVHITAYFGRKKYLAGLHLGLIYPERRYSAIANLTMLFRACLYDPRQLYCLMRVTSQATLLK